MGNELPTVAKVVVLYIEEVEDDSEEVDDEGEPEGGEVACVVDGESSADDAESHADVPTGELGGVGCAALIVGCEGDEHGLHAWPDVAVAESDDEGGSVVADGGVESGEEEVAEETDEDAVVDVLDDVTPTEGTGTNESGEDESAAEHGEPCSCTGGDVEHFFSVDGKVGGEYAVGSADAGHHDSFAPCSEEEEAVEGEGGFVGHNLFGREMDGGVDGTADTSSKEGDEENDVVVANGVVDEKPDGGGDAGGKIV